MIQLDTRTTQEGTRYARSVVDFDPQPLKTCKYNDKIGGLVTRSGPLLGARIYGLTLEERATCYRGCGQWANCYGNHMPFAKRHLDNPTLRLAVEKQLDVLCRTPQPLLVRLHVLGDFPSVDYVQWWATQLTSRASMWLYGYTHWPPFSPVGEAVQDLLNTHSRVRILQSVDRPDQVTALDQGTSPVRGGYALVVKDWADTPKHWVKCPAELTGRDVKCADCALCFAGKANVVFKEH